jgi:hypothetical protein
MEKMAGRLKKDGVRLHIYHGPGSIRQVIRVLCNKIGEMGRVVSF